MRKILIVEDDILLNRTLGYNLASDGYEITAAYNHKDAVSHLKETEFDVALLDINLPGQNGYSLCASIRQFSDVPILFITGRNTTMDELQALTLGGDDFISKPYNIPILLARINALLKRGQAAKQTAYLEYNRFTLNPIAGTLAADGREIELTKTELKIMYYFFEHPGEIVPRLDLVEYLWDNEIHIDDNTLSVNIMRIREKLRTLGGGELIQTKRGMGYKI